MMTTPAPLSDERLAEIRAMLDEIEAARAHIREFAPTWKDEREPAPTLIACHDLLAHIAWQREMEDRAQAQIERLSERNGELREIVRVVAEADNSDNSICYQLCSYGIDWTENDHAIMTHTARCVVEQARAALGLDGDGEVTTCAVVYSFQCRPMCERHAALVMEWDARYSPRLDPLTHHEQRIAAQDARMPEPLRAVMSKTRYRAEKAASGPAAAYTYVETLQAPERPQRQLRRGRGHQHDWQPWGDDERYERCTVATCGAVRLIEVKQGELF